MRQPYAQALCESTVHQGPPPALYGRGGARRHWEMSLVCLGVGGGMRGDLTAEEQLEPPDELPRHWGNAFS